MLREWLERYPDKNAVSVLLDGFTYGFRIGYLGPRVCRDSVCLPSAAQRPHVVREKLSKELSLGRIAGPFAARPLPLLQCSPIGLVPKHEPGAFRLIHHLSHPSGRSINDFIPRDRCVVHYASFDTAVDLVMRAGVGAWLAKSDIKSAFRLLPVHPEDYELLGFTFDGLYYYDKCLPMGCSISCSLFELFSTFLEFQVKQVAHSQFVTHYLDDFLFIGTSSQTCGQALLAFTGLCEELGVPLAVEKTLGPVQVITYLGLEIDTVSQQVRVPAVKVDALCNKIHAALCKKKLSLVDLQSLVGSLNFVCRAVSPGRAFLRRLIALSRGLSKPHHRVRVSKGARLDLLMWLEFLEHFNGVSPILGSAWDDSVELFTDAAASVGYGAFFQGKWVQGRWPSCILEHPPSIAFLEFFPLLVAVLCWGPLLANRRVTFRSDNSAVVHIINSQTSHCDRIMHLVRLFVLHCLKYNIIFKALHVQGVSNVLADSLSRFQMDRFRAAAPNADQVMTRIPSLSVLW